MEALHLREGWSIPAAELSARFSRSGGPGGQNVNKVSTKAELRFSLVDSSVLNESQKRRFKERYARALTSEGLVVLSCDETRSQSANLERARERLRAMILSIAHAPTPRRPTRPSRAQKRRRLEDKRRRSQVKRLRGGGFD